MKRDARRVFISIVSSGWARAWRGDSAEHGSAACFTQREALDYIKDGGDKKDAEGAGREHAADDGGAHDLARDGTRTAGRPERHATEDECERGHEDGAQT